ncbi:MAG: hypothetical protein DPW09_11570 [Anaerolineae bacterium]|nr:hypothetical protein [Anaerolineae bacterium]
MRDLTGQQLGSYQIIERLGEGGMAVVYKAYQAQTDRHVALKVLPAHFAADPNFASRFEQEARILAKLNHAHILPLFDYGQMDGQTYIVMPLVSSGTLADLMKSSPLPLEQILQIINQVGSALNYAHTRGLVHRDVKPDNILIDDDGNCRLTDFGIAKFAQDSNRMTRTGVAVGTPAYMSPEQIRGEELDRRSDIYSLGVVLYEMATGRPPFEANTTAEVMVRHLHEPLPLPRTLNPKLPETVEAVIVKSLAKRAEDRYATAHEMAQALQAAILAKPESTVPPAAPKLVPEPKKEPKHDEVKKSASPIPIYLPIGCIVVVALFLCLAGGAGAAWWSGVFDSSTEDAPTTEVVVATPSATPITSNPVEPDTPTPSPIDDTPTLSPLPTATPLPVVTTKPAETPQPTMTPSSTPTPLPAIGIIKEDNVNVRSGPSQSYDRVVRLAKGEKVTIMGRTEGWDWYEITTAIGQEGWISGDFVQISGDPQTIAVIANLPPTPTRGSGCQGGMVTLTLEGSSCAGVMGANGNQWFTFNSGQKNGPQIIVAFVEGEKAELFIYDQTILPDGRIPANPDELRNIGLVVDSGQNRDNNSNTKELIWNGSVLPNTKYYLRLANRSNNSMKYCLAPKDAYQCP